MGEWKHAAFTHELAGVELKTNWPGRDEFGPPKPWELCRTS